MKLNKRGIFALVLIIFLLGIYSFYFPRKPEFIVLHHMTRSNSTENSIDEVILVKNPPKEQIELHSLITKFTAERPLKFENIDQVFIKQHDYILFPALTLSENIDYSDSKTSRDKLDNADFLAERRKFETVNSKTFDTIEVWIGDFNYYKNK